MEMSPIREGKTAAGEPANQPLDLKPVKDNTRPDRPAASGPAALKPTEQALRDRLPSDEAFIQALERVGASLAELRADIFPEPGKPAPQPSLPDPEGPEMRHDVRKSGWAATGDDDQDTRPAGIHYEDYNIVPPPPPEALRRRSLFVPVMVMLLGVGAASTAFLVFRDGHLKSVTAALNPMLQRAAVVDLPPAGGPAAGAGATTGSVAAGTPPAGAATVGAATVQAARAADLGLPAAKPEARPAAVERVEPRLAPPAGAKPAAEPFTQAFQDFQPSAAKPAPQGELVTAALPPAAPSAGVVAAPPAAIAAPNGGASAGRTPADAPAAGGAADPAVGAPPKPLYTAAEIDQLRDRAEAYVKRGQIANARSVLDALHRQGDARSTFILATTYDPVVLQAWSVIGITADPAKARALYVQAAKAGIQGAAAGLARLQDQ